LVLHIFPEDRVLAALKRHWPEYLMEVAGLGLFMISAAVITTVLQHPDSPLRAAVPQPAVRRVLIGIGMGLTAAALIYSPWGRRSGAHLNPSTTLTFFRLGKVAGPDAVFYAVAQFAGAVIGILVAYGILGQLLADPAVEYVATVPGSPGPRVAFVAEAAISFGLMLVVLMVTNTKHLMRFTGAIVAVVVATYISIESPVSGMSMNPARTFGPSLLAGHREFLWIYFLAPPLGMLCAAELYVRVRGRHGVLCAKLNHSGAERCIFRCGYAGSSNRQDAEQGDRQSALASNTQLLRRTS
jgi:aquaporin Z